MIDPEEVMRKFNFLPEQSDNDAAFIAAKIFIESCNKQNLEMGDVEIFYCGFYRGIYWALEKEKKIGGVQMTKEELKKEVENLELQLNKILPEGWRDKWETYEDQRDLFSRCYDKADKIALKAIELLKG